MQPDQSEMKIREFYNSTKMEEDRLEQSVFKLEKLRSRAIIQRYLRPGGMTIVDIGGATGVYSFWLQSQGYSVHLLDSAEAHIEMARQTGNHLKKPLDSVKLGDARSLPYVDGKFELALVLGPLYHLQEQKDRVQTLKEARRVLRPGGIILAATITRYASLLDGFRRSLVMDPNFVKILDQDLESGQHHNPTEKTEYFTDAYFHTETEIISEFVQAGFATPKVMAIEGFGWLIPDFERRWEDESYREKLIQYIELTETNPAMIGISSHVMTAAIK
jgi:ubiquinone/menaquinone biosynthesis C-methylase UbiE